MTAFSLVFVVRRILVLLLLLANNIGDVVGTHARAVSLAQAVAAEREM